MRFEFKRLLLSLFLNLLIISYVLSMRNPRNKKTYPSTSPSPAPPSPTSLSSKPPLKLPHTYPPEQCGELEKVFTGENYSVWKGEKSIALIDSNAKKSGLVLPVTNNNYIVEHVTVIRPGNLDSMRIIFAASYSKPVFTGDISFVSPSCPEILKRHVIHIPFKVLCLTTVNNNNQVVVAVENNHKDDSKWHVCFCHYDLVDDKFVNLGKYYSFDSSSGALYHKNDVKIQLDKNLTKFTACDIPGKQEVKRQIICTHNKKFHVDELLAIAMLRMLDKYKDAAVVRTRDPELWNKATVLVDVGEKYSVNGEILKFDHHQSGFSEKFSSSSTSILSSAGLVYKTYGRVVISKLLTERKGTTKPSEDLVEKLYTLIYRDFIEEIDARDNGFDNPYTITDSFVTELIDHAMTLIPKDNATQPIKQTQTNRRGGGNKYAKSNNPPKSNNQPPSKHKIMEEINKFSGIKFKPRFSGRLGLSGVSTEVAKLNVAAIYAARTLSDKKDDAEAIATNVLFANNEEDAEKYQKELDNILLEEGKLENDSNSVFSIQRNEHFDQGVQLLSSFFLEAFDAACLKMSKN